MNKQSIYDLHGDLLCYLAANKTRTPYDPEVRCSIPQLMAGPVALQILPIFTETAPDSVAKGAAQATIFNALPQQTLQDLGHSIKILPAIENASSFCEENESINQGIERLEKMCANIGRMVYISFTWNTENRFGGGALTSVGLKKDGKELLYWLHQKKIAVDLSHASDRLAYDILNEVDRRQLDIPIMASHSNFRSVTSAPRNLPDEIALEIIQRRGLIGLNFVRYFIGGDSYENFIRHAKHALDLGGEHSFCFGADFFYGEDFNKHPDELYFSDFSDASVYGKILDLWRANLGMSEEMVEKIAQQNVQRYLEAHEFV